MQTHDRLFIGGTWVPPVHLGHDRRFVSPHTEDDDRARARGA
jgi:hypothetical protein